MIDSSIDTNYGKFFTRFLGCREKYIAQCESLVPTTTAAMLVLYETAMGYCLFKVTDSAKLESADLWKEFESPEKASKLYVP